MRTGVGQGVVVSVDDWFVDEQVWIVAVRGALPQSEYQSSPHIDNELLNTTEIKTIYIYCLSVCVSLLWFCW